MPGSNVVDPFVGNKWITSSGEETHVPVSVYGSGDKPRKVTWILTTMPTIDFEYVDGTFPGVLRE